MTYRLAAVAALFATPAFAHPGHTELADGHTHSLAELALMGGLPALLVIAGLALVLVKARRRDD